MRRAGRVVHIGKKKNAHRFSVGRPEERTPLGRPRHRWELLLK
jgi:hypothetical protein